jgi:hypothetical protein
MGFLKYIVFDDISFIIFSPDQKHADLAGNRVVVGAGQIDIMGKGDGDVRISCFGESTTLNVMSRGDVDASIIQRSIVRPW